MNAPETPDDINDKFIKEGARKITDEDVEKVVNKADDIKKKFTLPGPLHHFIEDAQLLLALVKDYRAGKYRRIPYWIIAAIVFTLIYVFNPLDLVPDVLPWVGVIDDATVVAACLMLVEQDLASYKKWRAGQ